MNGFFCNICGMIYKYMEPIRIYYRLSFVFLFVFSIWFFYPDLIWYLQGRSPITAYSGLGEFGDMFGSLNTLFSGLAFSAVVVTLLLQKQQLAISQQELKLTRDEMATQSELFRIQTEAMNQQLFEGTLFQLIKFYLEQSSTFSSGDNRLSKWDAIYQRLDAEINLENDGSLNYHGYDEAMSYSIVRSSITPVSLFLKIIKYIDESTLIMDSKKQFYIDLLKSNISNVEMYIFSVVIAYDERFNEYQKYIEKYAFLDMLDLDFALPVNVFCNYKMAAYKLLRCDVFDMYISIIISSGLFKGLFDFETGENICEIKCLSRHDYRLRFFGDYNCIIR